MRVRIEAIQAGEDPDAAVAAFIAEQPKPEPPAPVVEQPKTLSKPEEDNDPVAAIMARMDCDPIEDLITLANARCEDPNDENYGKFVLTNGQRIKVLTELAKYRYPNKKATDSGVGGGSGHITVILNLPSGRQDIRDVGQRGKVIDA